MRAGRASSAEEDEPAKRTAAANIAAVHRKTPFPFFVNTVSISFA